MRSAVAALVRERGGSAVLTTVSVNAPRNYEVLVRIMASGVCPTDIYGIDGGSGERYPAVFGHEGAGVVEAVGDLVTAVAPGDHVALSFDSCGECPACADGHPAYCARFGELNYSLTVDAIETENEPQPVTTGWMAQSAWATHVLARESNTVRIDDDVPWPIAAVLGCGALTGGGTVLNVLRPGPLDALLVIGAGTTGLAAVMAAHHRGVGTILVSDPDPSRRKIALELGATSAHDPSVIAEQIAGLPSPTHAIDTVGVQQTLDLALATLVPRGVCASVALRSGSNRLTLSQSRLLWGRTLRGVIEGDAEIRRDIPTLIALWRAGRLPLERIITRYPFAEIDSAIEDARTGRVIKAVLQMEPQEHSPAPSDSRGRSLLETLRTEPVSQHDLALIWRSMPTVSTTELRGLWRGFGLSPDHPVQQQLVSSGWFGKLFRSDDEVAPIIRETNEGSLVIDRELSRGGATLRAVEHDGIVTAAMLYNRQPIVDLFTRLGPDALLGVMTGPGTLASGHHFYFVLERADDRTVTEPPRG